MIEKFKYGLQLANKNHEGIRVRIIIEKETSDLPQSLPMEKCEAEDCLREIGSYLWSRADFKNLSRVDL